MSGPTRWRSRAAGRRGSTRSSRVTSVFGYVCVHRSPFLGTPETRVRSVAMSLRRTLPFLGLLLSLAVMSVAPLRSSADPAPAPQGQTSDVRYGPIMVPAATAGHPGEFEAVVPAMPMPCTNCFLTGTKVDLVFEDGRSANLDNGLMLHHIVVFNAGRPDATCAPNTPIGPLRERFFAAGNERTGGSFPAGFGYHYGADRGAGAGDLMNHSHQPQVVYVTTTVTREPDSTAG